MGDVATTMTPTEGNATPNKQSVWRLLRENPYLFGLSAVSIMNDSAIEIFGY